MPELFSQKYATSENRTIFLSFAVYTGAPVQGDKLLFYPYKENPEEQNRKKKDKQKKWLFKYPEINMAELFSSVRLTTIIQSPCKQTLFGRNNTYVKGSLWLSSSIFYISMSLHEFLIRLSLSGIFPLRILRIIQRPKLRKCLFFPINFLKSFFLISIVFI